MKSRLLMLLSLIVLGVGIIGAVLTRVDAPKPAAPVAETEPQEPQILIWVPKEALELGQRIERSDLLARKVPESEALEYGVTEDVKMTFVSGMVVNRMVESDTPLFPEDIVLPNQAGYFKLIMEPGTVPYPISVDLGTVVGGVVEAGAQVDVLALGAKSQNLANGSPVRNIGDLTLAPILFNVKVLQVTHPNTAAKDGDDSTPKEFGGQGSAGGSGEGLASVILQLSRKEVAMLTVAKRISHLEVHLSTGNVAASELSADAGDVMTDFKSVKEYRPGVDAAGGVQ